MTQHMKIFLTLICFTAFGAKAQEHQWNLFPGDADTAATQHTAGEKITGFTLDFNTKPGQVKVNQDNRVDKITEFIGTPQGANPVKIKGYRLQLFFSTDKDQVNQKRGEFLSRTKNLPAYIDYLQPNFRLRGGDFRTKLQAQKLQEELKNDFPDAIIVEDWIELPALNLSEGK